MFSKYEIWYRGKFVDYVYAMTENSAKQKAELIVEQRTGVARSASAYTGLDTRNIEVKIA